MEDTKYQLMLKTKSRQLSHPEGKKRKVEIIIGILPEAEVSSLHSFSTNNWVLIKKVDTGQIEKNPKRCKEIQYKQQINTLLPQQLKLFRVALIKK